VKVNRVITFTERAFMHRNLLLVLAFACFGLSSPSQQAENPKDYTGHVVGYAHMDMAWLWRWEESIHDIMYNTFRNQLDLMNRFPDYTYAQDQAVVFSSMEHYYPDLFKEIVQQAKADKFIPVSSSWVQMDENVIDGESIARQFLYGQKYSKEKFGHYIRAAWQPDVFGHPVSMPQIAKKAGIDFYLFNRPHDATRPPIIWWKGLDGSQIIGYTTPGEYTQPLDHEHATVVGMKSADRVGVKDIMVLYGMGDHGGGPNPEDVEGIAKLNASPNDMHIKTTNVSNYVDILLAGKKDFPVYDKELNFVFPGCFTTQVEMKRHNRQAEQLLLNAEKMSEMAVLFNYRDYYPNRDITEAWKLTLLNQAHDLAAGSGIGPIYADAALQYQEVFERANRALDFSLQNLGLQVDTQGKGLPLVVYNPQSWDRSDLVTAEVSSLSPLAEMVAVRDNEVIPVQVLKPDTKAGSQHKATVAFVAHNVPQMGMKLYRLEPGSRSAKIAASAVQSGTTPRPFLENEFFKLEIDPQTGRILHLYDKVNKREVFKGEGSSLIALEDTAEQALKTSIEYGGPAWDIGLTGKAWNIDKAKSVAIIEKGPVRATVRIVHRFRNSEFTQESYNGMVRARDVS
jgi:alpha-mannosidase